MKRLPRISRGRDRTKRRKVDYTARRRRRTRVMNAHIFKSFLLFVRDDISFDRPDGGIRVVTVTRAAMATALAHSIATVALPRAHPARSRLARAFRARVRVAASAGGDPEVTPERRLQLEKADALREEYDGVSTRARRLLTRGGRLAEKIDELTAGAERAMTLGADRDEDQARRLLRERAQVKEALDRTIARAEVLKELARKIEMAIIVYAGEIADESAEGAVAAPSANAKDVAPGSLEAEFASLEINLLERAFAASGAAASETAPTRDETLGATKREATREADSRLQSRNVAPPRDVPGWWRDASDEELLPDEKRNEKTSEKPLDALLSLDRARVSSVGVRPSDAVRLRVACAAHGAEDVARSKRLEGGKRDTAFRAGVEAAFAAVETEEGLFRVSLKKKKEKEKKSLAFFGVRSGGRSPCVSCPTSRATSACVPRARARWSPRRSCGAWRRRSCSARRTRARATGTTRGARASSWRGRSSPSRRRRRRRRTASASRWWRCARRGSCARTSGAKCSRCFQMRAGRAKACGRSSGSRSGSRRSGSRTRLVFDTTRSCLRTLKVQEILRRPSAE